MSKFFTALKSGDLASAHELWTNSPNWDLKEVDEDGWRGLHWAAFHGDAKLVTILGKAGAILDGQTKQGFTPVYLSARQGQLAATEALIQLGANLNLQDGHLQTALHRACENEHQKVALLLIPKTNVNLQDMMGRTALHWASSRDLLPVVQSLLQHGANLLQTKGGEDAIHWASRSGCVGVVGALLQAFPSHFVYSKNERNESAVSVALTTEIRDLLQAHALSLGQEDQAEQKIQNLKDGEEVVGVTRVDNKKPVKKMTIKMKERK